MRQWLVVCLALALAGCTGGDDGAPAADQPTAMPPSPAPLAGQVDAPPVTTDTLHFQGVELTPVPPSPTATEPVLVAVQSAFARAQQSDLTSRAMWTYQAQGEGAVSSVEVHLWLRIDRPLANPYTVPGTCAWAVWFEVRDQDGQLIANDRPCVTDGPQVPAGDRELVFSLHGLSGAIRPGFSIGLGLDVGPFDPSAPDAVHLLTGTTAFDSRIVVASLAEPVA